MRHLFLTATTSAFALAGTASHAIAHTDPTAHGTLSASLVHWLTSAHHAPVIGGGVLAIAAAIYFVRAQRVERIRSEARKPRRR